MVKRGHSPTAAVCSIIRSRPRGIRRSGSRASLDVKGSYVMKKIWLFEGLDEFSNTDDQLSDRDTAKDELCLSHSWFLFTNLACSQHCANCRKRILPYRAAYKCTACKQICHLKCAIKPEDMPEPDGLVENVNSEINEFGINTDSGNVPKQHSQTRNVARLRKQIQEEEEVEEAIDSQESFDNFKKKSDLNASKQSQAKLKFSSMKHNIVKRCKSIKKKVQKKKKEPEDQIDNNNNNDHAIEERIQAERQAWVTSPVRTRLKARKTQMALNSENGLDDDSFDQPVNSVTERRRRVYSTQKSRPKVRAFLHDYELTITHIRDRLDSVEEKIKQLQTTIPTEMGKWKDLQNKYREEYSLSQFDSIPVDSIGTEININHETKLKQLEAEGNLQSGSSGTASDEIFLVKDKSSTSSQEYMETSCERRTRDIQPCDEDFIFPEDMSLPSAIPVMFRSGEKTGTGGDHQTSTPLTDHGLGYFKTSQKKDGTHSIKHTSIIKLEMSPKQSKTYLQDIEMDTDQEDVCELKQTVLSPEQRGVKHFLRQRSVSDLKLSPSKHNKSSDRFTLYNSSPMASSTLLQGDNSILASETSPFSFTFRHDLIDRSQASFAKVLDESKLDEGLHQNTSHQQNCSSNLSFTFRNDSQMIPTNDDEDLPGFTRNHSFLTQGQGLVSSNESAVEDEVDMAEASIQYTEVLIHERPESSMLTDRTSLTNVTRPTGDFVNSFDDKSNKSRWVNKDVLMFSDSAPRQFEHFKRCSPSKVDERGDSNDKPPIGRQNKTDRNFLTEAQNKLKSFHIRRNSRENLSVGVCLEKGSYLSDGTMSDNECIVQENFVKETVTLREHSVPNDMEKKLNDMEYQIQSRENTLLEFEKMEKLCQEESMEQKSLSSRNQTSLSKLESQIVVDTEKTTGTSISRTSSMESKSSAKYHFLHDKGMIKIESPSLKLVATSPEKRRKQCMQSKLFEEESTDMIESGSESELEGVSIDDDFHLNPPQRLISADVESEVNWSKTDDITSETDEMDSQIKTEQQMLVNYLKTGTDRQGNWYHAEGEELDEVEVEAKAELRLMTRQVHRLQDVEDKQAQRTEKQMLEDYLKTVDEGQETWENVMKWMHKECDDAEGEELEAELKLMIKQGDSLDYKEGLPTSDINQDDSIYYSFQAQSDNFRQLITQECEKTSVLGGCKTYDRNGVKEMSYISDDETNSSLMFTIMNGNVDDVKRLLNSDRTISESEIKDGLIWALTNKHLPITILLLEDIGKLIRAAEEESIVEVFPAYSKTDQWDPLFVVLSKSDPAKIWDMFMGLPVYRRRCNLVSSETYLVENHSVVKSNPLSSSDSQLIEEVIKDAELHKYHSKITGFNCSAFRSKKEGKEIVKQNCIVIYCLLKGFVPFGENLFPGEIDGIPTDIREAFYDIDSITEHSKTSPTNQNLLDNNKLVQNGSSNDMIECVNGHVVKETMEVFEERVANEGVTCKGVTNSLDTVLYKCFSKVVCCRCIKIHLQVTTADDDDDENVTNKATKDDTVQHCEDSPSVVLDEDVHMEENKAEDTK